MHRSIRSVLRARPLRATLVACALGAVLAPAPSFAEAAAPARAVNVNTATAEELESLPGVGPARAQAILDARKSKGGFKTVEELEEVKGIGPSGLEKLRSHVTVDGRASARSAAGN